MTAVQCATLEMGDKQLTIRLTDNGRDYLLEQIDQRSGPDEDGGTRWLMAPELLLMSLLEHQLCNGWEWILPERIGALTSAPIIGWDCALNDQGDAYDRLGRVFWFPDYMVVDELAELLENVYIIFLEVEYNRDL